MAMTETAKVLSARPRALPPADRPALADDTVGSLGETNSDFDRLWAAEAEDHLATWHRGEIRAVPRAEVLRKYGRA